MFETRRMNVIYYNDGHLVSRDMTNNDVARIHHERLTQGWHSDTTVYERYFREQQAKCYMYLLRSITVILPVIQH